MNELRNLGRPPGAEEHERDQFTNALHTPATRRQRINDFWYNSEHFTDADGPLTEVLEENVQEPASNEIPDMTVACMAARDIYIKGGYGHQSTLAEKVFTDKGGNALVHAHWNRKMYSKIFGALEAKQFAAGGSTRDATPEKTALNPTQQRPLHASKMVADYSFSLEDIYASVIPTSESQVQDLDWDSGDEKNMQLSLRKELSDMGVVEVKTSGRTKNLEEFALALRYSPRFARDEMRLSVVDGWVDFTIIRARNGIRNVGARMAATGASTGTLAKGYSLQSLRKMDFHFMDIFPMSLLIMGEDTFIEFDQPVGVSRGTNNQTSENARTRTLVDIGGYSLLNNLSANTDVGVTKQNVILADDTNKILQIAPDECIDLHVYNSDFMVSTAFIDDTNPHYLTRVQIEFVPIIKQNDARHVWTVTA